MNFENFKEIWYKKNPFIPEIDPSNLNKPDLVNEIVRTNIEITLQILEEYNKWVNEQKKDI